VEGKGGRWSGVNAAWRAGTGKREGAPGEAGTARATGIDPRPVGTGGAVAARQGWAVGRE
jgi:hypothetical protein